MRCQACHANETKAYVICDPCVAHYASIREGNYNLHELTLGDRTCTVRSWTAGMANTVKQAARDAKAAKGGGGLFGLKKKTMPEPEAPPPPPPDWSSRVKGSAPLDAPPSQDERDDEAALAAERYRDTGPLTAYSEDGDRQEEAVALELPVDTGVGLAAATAAAVVAAETAEALATAPALPETPLAKSAPALETAEAVASLGAEAVAIEPLAEPDPSLVAEAPAPVAELAPEPTPPAPELANFLDSLGAASEAAAVAEAPAPVEPEPAPLDNNLADFFSSLGSTDPVPPSAAAPETPSTQAGQAQAPAPTAAADALSDFFNTLGAPAPVASPSQSAPEAPASSVLDTLPQTVNSLPDDEELAAGETAFPSLDEAATDPFADPFSATSADPFAASAEVDPFAAPSAPPEAVAPSAPESPLAVEPPPVAEAVSPIEPAPVHHYAFSLDSAPTHSPVIERPKSTASGTTPFAIDLGSLVPPAPSQPPAQPERKPIEIDLSALTGGEQPRQAQAQAQWVQPPQKDDDERSGSGLLDGLQFTPDLSAPDSSWQTSHRAARDDDDDDGKTIEL